MKEQQKISIKIADVTPISMTINPQAEEVVREAEYNVNKVWSTWRHEFENKTSKEVLAMVAFQFAKLYYQLSHTVAQRQGIVDTFEAELDRLLALTNDPNVYSHRSDDAQ
ncbi:MAG: cell division protein ZapA [Muribaculaceae bacterium]|nr:cell division protein ZapA [Muribaculaceae bacterium]